MSTAIRRATAAAFLLAALAPATGWAQEQPHEQSLQQSAPAPFGDALTEEALGGVAGREDRQQAATAQQTAGVSRNSVGDNVTTGEARIADNAFQNMSGLSVINVNTGNNVAINAAMNVNISISPGQ